MTDTTTTLVPSSAPLKGSLRVPGDKSISHRAIMLASMAQGTTHIQGFAPGADNRSTIGVFQALGAEIHLDETTNTVVVHGKGRQNLQSPHKPLDCGNSGTTMRLCAGILAGLDFKATLVGDASLSSRPMERIATPLRDLGALVDAAGEKGRPPVHIHPGGKIQGKTVTLKVASAQVKSALLFASLLSGESITIHEPHPSRDHSEVMLRYLGVHVDSSPHYRDLDEKGTATVTLSARQEDWDARDLLVPGDISSAAFLLVAAAIVKGSHLTLTDCGVTPTRKGVLEVLKRAKLSSTILETREAPGGEPVADILIQGDGQGEGFEIYEADVPTLVDEIPVLAVLAARLPGTTTMRGLRELRVKESDRLERTLTLLQSCGADAKVQGDDLIIQGNPNTPFTPFSFDAHHDHRMAAAAIVASLVASAPCQLVGLDSLAVSYPHFLHDLQKLQTPA